MKSDSPEQSQSWVRPVELLAYFVGFIFFVQLALNFPWSASFWLDECVSIWISSAGPSIAHERASQFQGQSPLFFVLLSLLPAEHLASEVTLRLASAALFVLSLLIACDLVRSWFGRGAVLIFVLALCSSDPFLAAALSIRPYSLTLFSLFVSLWLLERSFSRHWVFRCLSFASLLLAIYLHYLYIVFVLIFLFRIYQKEKLKFLKNPSSFLFFAALLPAVYSLLQKSSRVPDWSGAEFSVEQAVSMLFPVVAIFAAGCAIAFASALLKERADFSSSFKTSPEKLWLLSFVLLPCILFPVLDLLLGTSLLQARYFLYSHVAVAALIASFFVTIEKRAFQKLFLLIFSLLLMSRETLREWQAEQWREAIQFVEAQGAASNFIYTGLYEGDKLELGEDLEAQQLEYLRAPVQVYARAPESFTPVGLRSLESESAKESIANRSSLGFAAANVKFRGANSETFFVAESYTKLLGSLGLELSAGFKATELDAPVQGYFYRKGAAQTP